MCNVFFHLHHIHDPAVFSELGLGRHLYVRGLPPTDERWDPCWANLDLTTWKEDERQVKRWILSFLIVSSAWRWLRRGRFNVNLILVLSKKECFYGTLVF
jgi:hypothetical protein